MSRVGEEADDLRAFEAIRKDAGVGDRTVAYRNVDLAEHSNAFLRVDEGNVLRCRYDYST